MERKHGVYALYAGGRQQENFYDSWVFARNALISTITKAPKNIALHSNVDWRSGVCGRTAECAHIVQLKLRQFYVNTPISHLVFVVFSPSLRLSAASIYTRCRGQFSTNDHFSSFFSLLVHLLLFVLSVFITIIKQTHIETTRKENTHTHLAYNKLRHENL